MMGAIPNHNRVSAIMRRSVFIDALHRRYGRANPMLVRRARMSIGPQRAGFVERLFFAWLDSNLRAGRISTVLNGKIISETNASRMVRYARAQGWLPTRSIQAER
jgi:hypothetical protein